MKAFRDLPEDHIYSQAVWRFCQGCCDKDKAGQNAAMSRPKSIDLLIKSSGTNTQLKLFMVNLLDEESSLMTRIMRLGQLEQLMQL